MKQCGYCAKEIDYNHQYCCDECERNALIFFNDEKKSERIVSIVNVLGFLGVMLGGLAAIIFDASIGSLVCAGCLLLLGVVFIFFPFAPESIIDKFKIKKSIKLIRIFAVVLLVLGLILLLLGFFVF